MPENSGCTACPLHRTTTRVCIWGSGNQNADIMLIGEAPGAEEEKNGKPFVGAAGNVLNEALSAAGLSRSDVYIANPVKCRPPQNRTPKTEELVACGSYLLEEIAAVRPRVIVAMGNTALQALTGKKAITKERGKPLTAKIQTDAVVIGTLHPASALYSDGPQTRKLIASDLLQAKTLAAGPLTDHTTTIVFPTDVRPGVFAETVAMLKRLRESPILAVDLEWTATTKGKDEALTWPWSGLGEVYSIAITGRVDGQYYSIAFGLPLHDSVRRAIQWLFENKPLVFHNMTADMQWIAQQGFRGVNAMADTMIMAHLLDETQVLKLEAVAGRYGNVPPGWKGVLYSTRPAGEMAWRRLLEYNVTDTYATLRAWYGMGEELARLPADRRDALLRLHAKLVVPGTRVMSGAAFAGVPIDQAALATHTARVRRERDAVAEKLSDIIGTTPKIAAKLAGSPQQTVAYLKRSLGLEIDSSRADDLKELVHYPAVETILEWRKLNKLVTAYLEPWSRLLARQGDGRLHTLYRPTGTRTGRMSTEGEGGGTLHTAPRLLWIREMIAAVPGRLIVSADYSQIELRTIAWIADESTMLRMYREGEDLHYATAAFIKAAGASPGGLSLGEFWKERGRWIAEVTKDERQGAKGANFGLAYGMQDTKFRTYAKTEYGVTLSMPEAKFMRDSYFKLYSRLLPWHEEIMRYARTHGHVPTPFGRWLAIDPQDAHVAINTPIQSTASDLTLFAISQVALRIKEERLRGIIIGFVHDAILVDAHEDDAERIAAVLRHTMENLNTSVFGFKIPIPLVADVKIGRTWAA